MLSLQRSDDVCRRRFPATPGRKLGVVVGSGLVNEVEAPRRGSVGAKISLSILDINTQQAVLPFHDWRVRAE